MEPRGELRLVAGVEAPDLDGRMPFGDGWKEGAVTPLGVGRRCVRAARGCFVVGAAVFVDSGGAAAAAADGVAAELGSATPLF